MKYLINHAQLSGSGYYEEAPTSEANSALRRLHDGGANLYRHRAYEKRQSPRVSTKFERKAAQTGQSHRHVRADRRRHGISRVPGGVDLNIDYARPEILYRKLKMRILNRRGCQDNYTN